MLRTARSIIGPLALLVAAGCYSYSMVPVEEVSVGAEVRARISAAQAERVGEVLGREDRVLEGKVVRNDSETFLLAVPSVVSTPGLPEQRLKQNLPLQRAEVVELEVRRLDPVRTGVFVAGAAAVTGFIIYEAFASDGSVPGGERPEGDAARIPLLSIPIW